MHLKNGYPIFASETKITSKVMVNQSVKTKQEVESFLRQFYPKLEIFGIIFLDRDKNTEA